MADTRVDIILSAKDEATRALRNVSASIDSLKNPLRALQAIGAAVGIQKLIGEFDQLVTRAQVVTDLSRGFDTLTSRVGETAGGMLSQLRPATESLISDMDLMRLTNNAIILGLPVTAESMSKLAEQSVKLGRAMGIDATHALESVIIGIGRQSRLWLDNIGIVVDVETVNKNLAKSLGRTVDELTDSEKKLGFYNATVAAAEKASAGLSTKTQTLGEKWQTFKTTIDNVVGRSLDELNRSVSDLTGSIRPEEFERATKQVVSGILGIAEAGLVTVRVLAAVSGGVLALTRDLADGDDPRLFGHFRDFASEQPGYQRALEELGQGIHRVRGELDGTAPSGKNATDALKGIPGAAAEARSGLEDVGAVGSIANAGLGLLAVTAGAKLYPAIKKGADGLVTLAAGGDKVAAAVFRTASVTEALTLASWGAVAGIGALVVGVGVLAYKATRAILEVTGLDRTFTAVFDNWMHKGDDASQSMETLESDVAFLDKALAQLKNKGVEFNFDKAKLEDAKKQLVNFNVYANGAAKVRIAADTAPLRSEIANTRNELQQFFHLSNANSATFEKLWEESGKKTKDFSERLQFVARQLAGFKDQAKQTGDTAAEPFARLNELLKALKLPEFKPDTLDQVQAVAGALQELDKIEPTLKTDAAKKNLADLRAKLLELRDRSLTINVAAKAVGVESLDDVLDRAQKIRTATEALDAFQLEGPHTEAAAAQFDRLKAKRDELAKAFLKEIPAPKIIGLDEVTGRKILLDIQLEGHGIKGLDEARKQAQETRDLLVNLLNLRGVPTVDPKALEVGIQKLAEEIKSADIPGIDVPVNVADPLAGIDVVKMGEDISEAFYAAFPVERVVSFDEAIQILVDGGVAKLNEQLKESNTRMEQLGVEAARSLRAVGVNSALAFGDTLVTAAFRGKEAFRGFFRQVLADLAKAIARALILKAILSLFGGVGGAAGNVGGGIALSGGSFALSKGGVARGRDGLRAAAPYFDGPPGGKVPGVDRGQDTVPALLRPTEIVLDPETSRNVTGRFRRAGGTEVAGTGGIGLTPSFRRFLSEGVGPAAGGASRQISIPASLRRAAGITPKLATGGFARSGGGYDSVNLAAAIPPNRSDSYQPISTRTVERVIESIATRNDSTKTVVLEPKGDVLMALCKLINARVEDNNLTLKSNVLVTSRSVRN